MSVSDRQYMLFFSDKKAPYIFRKSSVGWLLRDNPLNLMTLSFACEVFFQFFRAPSEPPAFPVWPVVIIDSLPVLSSLHSLQSWRARSSAPAAD